MENWVGVQFSTCYVCFLGTRITSGTKRIFGAELHYLENLSCATLIGVVRGKHFCAKMTWIMFWQALKGKGGER